MDTQLETNNKVNYFKISAIVLVLMVLTYGTGYVTGQGKLHITSGKIEINKGEEPKTSADYSLLWDALDTLNAKYVDRLWQ